MSEQKTIQPYKLRLTKRQYEAYINGLLALYDDEDNYLQDLADDEMQKQEEYSRCRDQMVLVESLLCNAQGHVELNEQASVALSNLLAEAREFMVSPSLNN